MMAMALLVRPAAQKGLAGIPKAERMRWWKIESYRE
jgi:hypothetical protein